MSHVTVIVIVTGSHDTEKNVEGFGTNDIIQYILWYARILTFFFSFYLFFLI